MKAGLKNLMMFCVGSICIASSIFFCSCGSKDVNASQLSADILQLSSNLDNVEYSTFVSPAIDDANNKNYHELKTIYQPTLSFYCDYIEANADFLVFDGNKKFKKQLNIIDENLQVLEKENAAFKQSASEFKDFVVSNSVVNSSFGLSLLQEFKAGYAQIINMAYNLASSMKNFQESAFSLSDCTEVVFDGSARTFSLIENINVEVVKTYFDFVVNDFKSRQVENIQNFNNNIKTKTDFMNLLADVGDFSRTDYLTFDQVKNINKVNKLYTETACEIFEIKNEIDWVDFLSFDLADVEKLDLKEKEDVSTILVFYKNTLNEFCKFYN